jgi:drug/metabolite transporter (DMT)-like permease
MVAAAVKELVRRGGNHANPTVMSSRSAPLDWIVLWSLVAMWGTAFAALKFAAAELSPAWMVTARLVIGAITLYAIMLARRTPMPPLDFSAGGPWRWYLAIGLLASGLPFFLFAFAAGRLDSALVAILNGGSPFFTALLAHLFLADERLTWRKALGVALGFAGLVLLSGAAATGDFGDAGVLAVAAGIIGAACYAVGNVATRKAPKIDPVAAALLYCLGGLILAAPIALFDGLPKQPPSSTAIISLLWLGAASTGVAAALYVWLIERRGSVFVSFITYLSPVWAMGVGLLFLGERPAAEAFWALALILGGVAIANARLPSFSRRERAGP